MTVTSAVSGLQADTRQFASDLAMTGKAYMDKNHKRISPELCQCHCHKVQLPVVVLHCLLPSAVLKDDSHANGTPATLSSPMGDSSLNCPIPCLRTLRKAPSWKSQPRPFRTSLSPGRQKRFISETSVSGTISRDINCKFDGGKDTWQPRSCFSLVQFSLTVPRSFVAKRWSTACTSVSVLRPAGRPLTASTAWRIRFSTGWKTMDRYKHARHRKKKSTSTWLLKSNNSSLIYLWAFFQLQFSSSAVIPKAVSELRVRSRDDLAMSAWSKWTPWKNVTNWYVAIP